MRGLWRRTLVGIYVLRTCWDLCVGYEPYYTHTRLAYNNEQNLVDFIDSNSGQSVVMNDQSQTNVSYDNSVPLGDWFSRPIRTRVYSWSENTLLSATFNPWYDYFSNPEVYSKIKGYSRLKCNLHVKLTVNSSPFMYSLGVMSYRPLAGGTTSIGITAPFSGGGCDYPLNSNQSLMVHTQYPHAFFKPHKSEGCEMVLPFIYPSPWINLKDSNLDTLKVMGNIYLSCFQNLYNSSGTAQASPINVSIYVWATDVKLSGPSMCLQSDSDEYGSRPVSTVASSVAAATGALTRLPYIGPYMRATSLISSAVGGVAKLFGFSNPPVIDSVHAVLVKPCVNLATPIIPTQIEKIAMDPKNELSISGINVGASADDHMDFRVIQDRDVYVNKTEWFTSDTYDAPLFSALVTPVNFFNNISWNPSLTLRTVGTQMTPGALLAQNFEYWRGDITYTFKIMASSFHRGRVRVLYDPNGPSTADAYTVPRVHQHIWDIADSDTFQLTIPYMASTEWLECDSWPCSGQSNATPTSPRLPYPTGVTYDGSFHNGYLQLSVLNELTSPAGGTVTIAVFVNTKDVEYSSPKYMVKTTQMMTAIPQSDDDKAIIPALSETMEKFTTIGESVVNLRSVIKRSMLWDVVYPSPFPAITPQNQTFAVNYDTTPESMNVKWILPRFPIPRTMASMQASPSTMADDAQYPWSVWANATNVPIWVGSNSRSIPLTLFAQCYVGWRGSVVWRLFDDRAIVNGQANYTDTVIQPERANWGVLRPTSITGLSDMRSSRSTSMSLGAITAFSDTVTATSNELYLGIARVRTGVSHSIENGLYGIVRQQNSFSPATEAILPMYTPYMMFPSNMVAYQKYLTSPANGTEVDTLANYGLGASSSDTISIERNFIGGNQTSTQSLSAMQAQCCGKFNLYASAGDDMSFFSFLAVPTMYRIIQVDTTYYPYIASTS